MSKLPVRETSKAAFSPRVERLLSLLQTLFPIAAGLATAIWAVNGYLNTQDRDLQQRADAQAARVREARKPFDERQLTLYFETARVAGVLATSNPSSAEWTPAKTRFYALYWSELSMVEDQKVEEAMVKFERSLRNYASDQGLHQQVRIQSYCLAHALKDSIAATWTINFGQQGAQRPPSDGPSRKDCEAPVVLLNSKTRPQDTN